MAFGKAPIQSADVTGWRQKVGIRAFEETQLRERRRTFGGSRIGNSFNPSRATPELVRLIPGSYKIQRAVELKRDEYGVQTEVMPYFEGTMHEWWYDVPGEYNDDGSPRKEKRDIICSGGPLSNMKKYATPCVGCRIFYDSPVGPDNKRKSRVNFKKIVVFSVLVYGTFVKVEQRDRNTGLLKVNEKTGKPYTYWTKKNQQNPVGIEEKEGHVMHWTVNQSQFGNIIFYDALIGRSCYNCRTQDSIVRYSLTCKNCKAQLVDCRTTALDINAQDKKLEEPQTCPYCNTTDYLDEDANCEACGNARRATIWDVDFNLMATPGSKGNPSQLVISSWTEPHPVDPTYKAAPLNLAAMYAPESLEVQAERFDVDLKTMNLQAPEAALESPARSRPYTGQ